MATKGTSSRRKEHLSNRKAFLLTRPRFKLGRGVERRVLKKKKEEKSQRSLVRLQDEERDLASRTERRKKVHTEVGKIVSGGKITLRGRIKKIVTRAEQELIQPSGRERV